MLLLKVMAILTNSMQVVQRTLALQATHMLLKAEPTAVLTRPRAIMEVLLLVTEVP